MPESGMQGKAAPPAPSCQVYTKSNPMGQSGQPAEGKTDRYPAPEMLLLRHHPRSPAHGCHPLLCLFHPGISCPFIPVPGRGRLRAADRKRNRRFLPAALPVPAALSGIHRNAYAAFKTGGFMGGGRKTFQRAAPFPAFRKSSALAPVLFFPMLPHSALPSSSKYGLLSSAFWRRYARMFHTHIAYAWFFRQTPPTMKP